MLSARAPAGDFVLGCTSCPAVLLSAACLVYVYAFPPKSMFSDRDGVAHFTPPVSHPETGEAIPLGDLIRHYRGD